jgi:hypothetical protein
MNVIGVLQWVFSKCHEIFTYNIGMFFGSSFFSNVFVVFLQKDLSSVPKFFIILSFASFFKKNSHGNILFKIVVILEINKKSQYS